MVLMKCTKHPIHLSPSTLWWEVASPLQFCPPSRKHQSLDKEQKCRHEKDSMRMPYSTCSIFLYRPCFLAMVSLVWVEKHDGWNKSTTSGIYINWPDWMKNQWQAAEINRVASFQHLMLCFTPRGPHLCLLSECCLRVSVQDNGEEKRCHWIQTDTILLWIYMASGQLLNLSKSAFPLKTVTGSILWAFSKENDEIILSRVDGTLHSFHKL